MCELTIDCSCFFCFNLPIIFWVLDSDLPSPVSSIGNLTTRVDCLRCFCFQLSHVCFMIFLQSHHSKAAKFASLISSEWLWRYNPDGQILGACSRMKADSRAPEILESERAHKPTSKHSNSFWSLCLWQHCMWGNCERKTAEAETCPRRDGHRVSKLASCQNSVESCWDLKARERLYVLKPDSNPNRVANVRHQCLTSQSTAFWRSEMKLAEQAASDLWNKPNKSVHYFGRTIQCDLAGASLSPEALH